MSEEKQKENTLYIQEQEQQNESLKLKNEDEIKSFTSEKAKEFIKKTGDLLEIDNYEKKEIIKKLGDKAPDFLSEIKNADNEFKSIMLIKNNEINNLTQKEYLEKEKLFLEKLYFFKKFNYNLLEKIDENDGNFINTLIDKTKFNKEEHEGFWNTPEAIGEGLSNGMLTKLNQYQNLFEGGIDGIMKLVSTLTENPVTLLKSIWEEIKKDFANLIDFDGPTYKIAQTIGKFLVDIIIQLVSGGAGIVGKLATTINKLIPNGIIKKGLNKTVDFSSKVITSSVGINKNLLSPQLIKKLGFKGTAKAIGNEAMYYGGFTPGIVFKEGHNLYKNGKGFNTWARRINKQLKKEGYKIPINAYANLQKLDGKIITKLVKIEKKVESNIGRETLKYLNLVDKGIKTFTRKDFTKIANLTGKSILWEKRIEEYAINSNDINFKNFKDSDTFKDFLDEMEQNYLEENFNKISYLKSLGLTGKEEKYLENSYLLYYGEDNWQGEEEFKIEKKLLKEYGDNFFNKIYKKLNSIV